jgi:glycerol kinase
VRDATAVGAALLAGLEIGTWSSWDDIAATWRPTRTVHPDAGYDRDGQRAQWHKAVERAKAWYGDLSALNF